jgi:hypothetical protein
MDEQKIRHSITYSEKEKMVLFLPPKTGTVHATFIFNHYDFTTDIYDDETEEIYYRHFGVTHHHSMNVPQRYKSYLTISTARNPYSRIVSAYNSAKKISVLSDKPIKEFKKYFAKHFDNRFPYLQHDFSNITIPDYCLRVESLYHDYIQIPFIKNSKLNKSGLLYELCNKKIHKTYENNNISLEEYYNEDMADFVYTRYKSYFDLLGYDKDSWKK